MITNFFKNCGLAGWVILLLTFVIAVMVILMAVKAKKGHQPLGLYAMLALLPLLIGMMGTASGYAKLPAIRKEFQTATGHKMDAERMEQSMEVARYPGYLGGGCTAGLLLICAGIGWVNACTPRDE